MTAAKSSAKPGRRANRTGQPSGKAIASFFVACPRCSFFLAGYRLLHDDFDAAAEHSGGEWLLLSWSDPVRSLVQGSYGARVDLDAYHFEGICPDCRRAYVIDAPDGELDKATFEIQVSNFGR